MLMKEEAACLAHINLDWLLVCKAEQSWANSDTDVLSLESRDTLLVL